MRSTRLTRAVTPGPLLECLRRVVPRPVDRYLTDLFDIYQLKRKRGGQRTPLWDRSQREIVLWRVDAFGWVKECIALGCTVEQACKEVATYPGVSQSWESLRAAYYGGDGSIRRMEKRRRKASPRNPRSKGEKPSRD